MKFFVFIALLINPFVVYSEQLQCYQLFAFQISHTIPMQKQYIGEDKGQYTDPITHKSWSVRYFTKQEREQFRLYISPDKKLVNSKNEPVSTEFDTEGMHFATGLVVLTTNYEGRLRRIKRKKAFPATGWFGLGSSCSDVIPANNSYVALL